VSGCAAGLGPSAPRDGFPGHANGRSGPSLGGTDRTGRPRPAGPLGTPTVARGSPGRDGGRSEGGPMTVAGDIMRTWPEVTVDAGTVLPEAILDVGPVELSDHHWGIAGSIPYGGHVVLALFASAPGPRGLHP